MQLEELSLYIYEKYGEGNSNGNPKVPKVKLENFVTNFNSIKNKRDILGKLKDDIIMIDVDDAHQANILYKIINDLDVKCIVKQTTHGKHFYFKYGNKGIPDNKNKSKVFSAIGVECEYKFGKRNERTLVKENGEYRKILRCCKEVEMDILPTWIYPIGKNNPQLLGLVEGDGRNQALYNHILRLIDIGLYRNNDGLKCMELINKYILKDPIPSEEFKVITRDDSWINKGFPYVDKNKNPRMMWENLEHILNDNNITAKYNVISKQIDVDGVNNLLDYDSIITDINSKCQVKGFKLSKDNLYTFMYRIAMENQYNPVREYLNDAKDHWDKKDRVKELYNTLNKTDNIEFNYILFHKWLLNCVAMAFNEGATQQDGILVLQGKQGINKTRWLKSISPYSSWVKEGLHIDPTKKDTLIETTKNWLVELGELEGMTSKKEQSNLKAFLTNSTDRVRTPYARTAKDYIRHTCYYATVNEDEFLRDDSGNRRYWVIKVKSVNTDHNIDLKQLWGQVTTEYLNGEMSYWLNTEEKEKLNDLNEEFRMKSSIEQKIEACFNWDENNETWNWKSPTEIGNMLKINEITKIGAVLKKMNMDSRRMSKGKEYKLPTYNNVCTEYRSASSVY